MSHNDKDMESKSNVVYFYMENGLIVFTEAYHRKKGYCCKQGCRHCPYGFRKAKEQIGNQSRQHKKDHE